SPRFPPRRSSDLSVLRRAGGRVEVRGDALDGPVELDRHALVAFGRIGEVRGRGLPAGGFGSPAFAGDECERRENGQGEELTATHREPFSGRVSVRDEVGAASGAAARIQMRTRHLVSHGPGREGENAGGRLAGRADYGRDVIDVNNAATTLTLFGKACLTLLA